MEIHRSDPFKELVRLIKFGVVGLTGTLIDLVLLVFFKSSLGFPTALANTLSYSAGIGNNYLLNRLWTFSEWSTGTFWKQFARFALISVIGLALNTLLVVAFEAPSTRLFGELGIFVAKISATGLVFFWNFTGNRLWTFKNTD